MYKRIVVKIGTKVISENDRLVEEWVRVLVEQVAQLRSRGVDTIVVTSGAVATGMGVLQGSKLRESATQVFAAVGQIGLMSLYERLFQTHGLRCAQMLLTKGDFRDKEHYANIKKSFENLLSAQIVPIVNENDAISNPKLVFTDNDELAGLIASQLNADAVVFLTSVEGVLGPDGTSVISEIREADIDDYKSHVRDTKSKGGRGGMQTKFGIAKRLMAQGIPVYIAKGSHPNVLEDIVAGKKVGTKFVPGEKLSAPKRRLAYSEGLTVGAVYVDSGAEKILLSKKSASLLPVGIKKIEGEFKKGDTIEIRNEQGKKLGFGTAQYDSTIALSYVGKKGAPALVHYNYLVITE